MDKQQILTLIEGQLATGKISKADLQHLIGEVSAVQTPPIIESTQVVSTKEDSSKKITNIFYVIGAIISVIGVGILIAQNWVEIGFAGRIVVTLGIAFVSYVLGFLLRNPEQKMLSQVLFTISAALAPLGFYILLKEANVDFDYSMQIMLSLGLSIIFGTALFITKRNILLLITVGFASAAYYSFVVNSFDFDFYNQVVLKWAVIFLGVSYLFIAYGYPSLFPVLDEDDAKEKKSVENVLYGFGTLAILGGGIMIGGFFDIILIGIIFAAFYGSVFLKSRSMLMLAALFLLIHIIKFTSKYFVDSIGWPITLIAIGFMVIGIGYGTFYLNKKFISSK